MIIQPFEHTALFISQLENLLTVSDHSNDVSNQVDIFSNDVLDITSIDVTPFWKKIFKMTAYNPKNHNPANIC